MIGKLSGILDTAARDHVLLDVNGVGYLVQCSPVTLSKIGQKGDPVSLRIDTHVREDALTLFGFADESEQHWFRLLYSVQGVGPKAAMAILGACPPDQLGFVIASGDKAALTRADGVGPKLAARILTELKDKAAKMDLSPSSVDGSVGKPVNDQGNTYRQIHSDAVSALINLGYGRSDAYQAVLKVQNEANDNLSDLIRLALKELSV